MNRSSADCRMYYICQGDTSDTRECSSTPPPAGLLTASSIMRLGCRSGHEVTPTGFQIQNGCQRLLTASAGCLI